MTGNQKSLRSRRIMDYRTMTASFTVRPHPCVMSWSAFASTSNADSGLATTVPEKAIIYEIAYKVVSPVKAEQYHDQWRVRIDASIPGYPFKPPEAQFLGAPKPWLPHVSPFGQVCWGDIPEPTRLIADLVVDLLKMLNFDENLAALRRTTRHYNPDSIDWWAQRHGGGAIQRLAYPAVTVVGNDESTSGGDSDSELFGAIRRP